MNYKWMVGWLVGRKEEQKLDHILIIFQSTKSSQLISVLGNPATSRHERIRHLLRWDTRTRNRIGRRREGAGQGYPEFPVDYGQPTSSSQIDCRSTI